MVKALDRKLLRDLLRLKGQVLTIALVVACGVATFLTFVGAFRSLRSAEDEFYRATRFADVFAQCVRAPEEVAGQLSAIPGVASLETRVAAPVTFDMPGYEEPIRGLLLSLPRTMSTPMIREGSLPASADEALVNEAFARAHKLRPGATVSALVEGRMRTFRVSGLAQSPEYVFAMTPGAAAVDDARFGILWADRAAVAAARGMEGAFNDVVMRLAPDASERAVLASVDRVLQPYGGFPAVGRDDQSSHHFVTRELNELKTWAIILPIIFVGVAAFLLNIVLARLIGTQREQIAALKAFGYGNGRVGGHYLQMIAVIVALGTLLGTGLGWYLGTGLTAQYTKYFRFPSLLYRLEAPMVISALVMTLALAAVGGFSAIRGAVRLSPAEAMRPPSPARYRRSLVERIGLAVLLSNIGRIVSRNLGRRPLRAIASVVGVGFATAIIAVGLFFGDAVDTLIKHLFGEVFRDDVTVVFRAPVDSSAVSELRHVEGVLHVEPTRMIPVRVMAGHRDKRVVLFALPAGVTLRSVRTVEGQAVAVPGTGVMLNATLATSLGVGMGDKVSLEVLDGAHPIREATVTGLVDEMFGLTAYMQLDALHRLIGEQESISSALLAVDPRSIERTVAELKSKPAVMAINRRDATLKAFRDTSAGWMLLVSTILSAFAGTIAFGVVYNTARINLAERERELASLRVLGFTVGEITTIFAGELVTLVLLGIPLGFLIGRGIITLILTLLSSEAYRFPSDLHASSLAVAALIVGASALASALIVRRKLDRLDLVAVLKTRD